MELVEPRTAGRAVTLVAVDMGYGHLRAAHALADELGVEVLELDRPPLAGADERRRWHRTRASYERLSRASQFPIVGRPLRAVLEAITNIPRLYPRRDLSAPTAAVRMLERLAVGGLGAEMMRHLRAGHTTLVTTFYAPAVIADHHGYPRIVCIVTDSDINRVWVARHGASTAVHYCVPSERAERRLRAYGVPETNVHMTGFPLPAGLLGGTDLGELRRNLAARIVRLDPKGAFRDQSREELAHFLGALPRDQERVAPLLTFAVGGAGAQLGVVREFLPSLKAPIEQGRLRLALVAGVRSEVADRLRTWVGEAGLAGATGVEIVLANSFSEYYGRVNALLARTDILWTKPSEMTFYAALGIPLVFSWPVGVHERANRRWALHRGAGFKQENPRHAWDWLREWLHDGTLAGAAWSGYTRLPKFGIHRIRDVVAQVSAL